MVVARETATRMFLREPALYRVLCSLFFLQLMP